MSQGTIYGNPIGTSMSGNTTNNKVVLGAKAIYDWAVGLFATKNNPTFTGTVTGVDKTAVGLGNVDNTSDINKPISTATQTALDLKLSALYTPLKALYLPHTGTVIKTLIGTIVIPANKFVTGDMLRINYTVSRNTGGGGAVSMICEIGGTVLINQNVAAAQQIARGNSDMAIINATNSQRSWSNTVAVQQQSVGLNANAILATTFNFTGALTFEIYGQMSVNTDTVILESLSIEKI